MCADLELLLVLQHVPKHSLLLLYVPFQLYLMLPHLHAIVRVHELMAAPPCASLDGSCETTMTWFKIIKKIIVITIIFIIINIVVTICITTCHFELGHSWESSQMMQC